MNTTMDESFNGQIDKIKKILVRQLDSLFGISDMDIKYIDDNIEMAIRRTLNCFSYIRSKYYINNEINILHSGQYFTFLYYFANTIYNENSNSGKCIAYNEDYRLVCDKIYCLNKMLSSCDVYYEVKLPDYFLIEHPVGSVIGRAEFDNGFMFYQGCTIGGNNGKYPILGKNVVMYSNSKILGDCHVGDNVLIGANSYIKDIDVPNNSMVFGQYPNNVIKENHDDIIKKEINRMFRLC